MFQNGKFSLQVNHFGFYSSLQDVAVRNKIILSFKNSIDFIKVNKIYNKIITGRSNKKQGFFRKSKIKVEIQRVRKNQKQ